LLQALPQPAQFEAVPSWVSQPAAALQSANPAAQLLSVQVPVAQLALAFGNEQATPHAPQAPRVRMLVSQPLSGMPSQSLKPASQVGAQPLAVQLVAPWALLQLSPQAVQLLSVPSAVSQPVMAVQSANPALQLLAVQLPPPQDSLEFGMSQLCPQAPQFETDQIEVSQPFSGLASQVSQPWLQLGTQPLALQLLVPCALEQALPQLLQFASVPSGVSQPAAPVQSAKPAPQLEIRQVPVAHDSLALARSQVTPQSPQFPSARTLVSQPLPRLPSQLFQPASQLGVQPLAAQLVAPWLLLQASPQPLQLASVPRGVSQPRALVQSAKFASHAVSRQLPEPHDSLAWGRSQPTPQPPQFASVLSSASQPLPRTASSSQLPNPASHITIWQVPVLQLDAAWALLQAALQAPQLARVFNGVSQPLLALPSQSPQPMAQVGTQPLAPHAAAPCGLLQLSPQRRQLLTVSSGVSQPGAVVQSAKPSLHAL
jgi:hypothetical protein